MTAGSMNASPATLVGGSALQKEHRKGKRVKEEAEEAFGLLKNKVDFINSILKKYEGLTVQKAKALAKIASYKAMKKAEKKLSKM